MLHGRNSSALEWFSSRYAVSRKYYFPFWFISISVWIDQVEWYIPLESFMVSVSPYDDIMFFGYVNIFYF